MIVIRFKLGLHTYQSVTCNSVRCAIDCIKHMQTLRYFAMSLYDISKEQGNSN